MPRSLVTLAHAAEVNGRQAPIDVTASELTDATADTITPISLEDTERETIRRVLDKHAGRRKAAAQELRISERTLYRKIKEYGLE